jgi:hypothetical protein
MSTLSGMGGGGAGGFGLNYQSGFGARPGGVAQQYDQQLNRDMTNQYQGFGYASKLAGQQQAATKGLADQQYSLGQQGLASQQSIARTQADASMFPAQQQQARFNQVFPFLTNALNNFGSSKSAYAGQGQVGTAPEISAAPTLNPFQVQQQVNTMRAGNDASAAGAQRGMQSQLAGRGLGASSPLSAALGQQIQGQNQMANTAGESQTRLGAAQQNAQQVLQGQQAQEGQFASRQHEDIERNKTRLSSYNALLGALGGLV